MALPPQPKLPTWTPAWSPPKGKLVPWPPAGYRQEYKVHRGESWESVAMGFLVPDVKDLIYFNFRTENPREVNWYMWRYLGCQQAARDGLNFSFAEATPGFLYIPPFGWKRSDHMLPFRIRIATEIDHCGRYFPQMWYRGVHISRILARRRLFGLRSAINLSSLHRSSGTLRLVTPWSTRLCTQSWT